MGLDIKQMFPKTTPHPKEEILRRVKEVKTILGQWPTWLAGTNRQMVAACAYGASHERLEEIPFEFTRKYYQKGPHNFNRENRKSSEVSLTPLFILPLPETGFKPFQLFMKKKDRAEVRQIWEYLMLDLWSHILRYYSQVGQITLRAPWACKIEGDSLYMSYNSGSIGDCLHKDFDSDLLVPFSFGDRSLFHAFALHLGALAHIKEAEEIKHGDYCLRHVLFDPGKLLDRFFYLVRANNMMRRKPTLVNSFLTAPSLGIADLEHGLRAPNTQVQQENENLLKEARAYSANHKFKPASFERAYREGYDLIQPQNVTQRLVNFQEERWGVSADVLAR